MILYPDFSEYYELVRKHHELIVQRIRDGCCHYCGEKIDEQDEVEGNFCCNRRLWDYCSFETYLETLD